MRSAVTLGLAGLACVSAMACGSSGPERAAPGDSGPGADAATPVADATTDGFAEAASARDASCPDPNGPLDAGPSVLELPHPTGPYAIGTQTRALVDPSRTDPQAPDPTTHRALVMQLFYPSDRCEPGVAPPYLHAVEAQTFELGSPRLPAGWEQRVLQHGRDAVPMSSDGVVFPLVLFSHGLDALRPTYVALIEDLVSHGFVVAAISHTYDSPVVVFPDGSTAYGNFGWEGVAPADDASAAAQETYEEIFDSHLQVWIDDARFVLDELTQLQASDPAGVVTGRLDLVHVGMFGHSYGGATSAEVCALDPRFKAGMNLDGTFFSKVRPDGGRAIPAPFMMQLNETHGLAQTDDPTVGATYARLLDAGYAVQIAGAEHGTFWDMGLAFDEFDGPGAWPFTGSIDHVRALAIIDAYTLAFFSRFLKGTSEPLLDGPTPYPEVTFDRR